jgi:hypothetical protein
MRNCSILYQNSSYPKERTLKPLFAYETEHKDYHFNLCADDNKRYVSDYFKKIRKEAMKLRQGNTWYTVTFELDENDKLIILVDQRMMKGKPKIKVINDLFVNPCIYIDVDKQDMGGSEMIAAGCSKRRSNLEGLRKMTLGGKKLKPLLRKAKIIKEMYCEQLKELLIFDRNRWVHDDIVGDE